MNVLIIQFDETLKMDPATLAALRPLVSIGASFYLNDGTLKVVGSEMVTGDYSQLLSQLHLDNPVARFWVRYVKELWNTRF
jgi:hypothetical protein